MNIDKVQVVIDGDTRTVQTDENGNVPGAIMYKLAGMPPVLVQVAGAKVILVPHSNGNFHVDGGTTYESRFTFDEKQQTIQDLIDESVAPLKAENADLRGRLSSIEEKLAAKVSEPAVEPSIPTTPLSKPN